MQVLAKNTQKFLYSLKFSASFKKFDYTDPLNFKSLLSEEEIMVNYANIQDYGQHPTIRTDKSNAQSHQRLQGRIVLKRNSQNDGRKWSPWLHFELIWRSWT
jgi:hypothetical protein